MNKIYNKKYSKAINCRFIAEIIFCFILQDLQLLKIRCGLSKRPGCFLIKIFCHDFAFSTRLMNLAIVPAIFISISRVVLKL